MPLRSAGEPVTAPPTIRVLDAGSLAEYRGLLRMFGAAFEDEASYGARPPDDAYARSLLSNPGFVAIAALEGEEVVGGLTGYVLPKFEQARSELYLYDLAVAEGHRRRGIATALIEALKVEARRRGIYVIFVQADQGDEPAIALYSKLGTREEVLHFDILPADPAA